MTAWHNHRLRRLESTTGTVYAHCRANPSYGGHGKVISPSTTFSQPSWSVQGKEGIAYVIDSRNWVIRKIAVDGTITTITTTIGGQKPKTGDQRARAMKKPSIHGPSTCRLLLPPKFANTTPPSQPS